MRLLCKASLEQLSSSRPVFARRTGVRDRGNNTVSETQHGDEHVCTHFWRSCTAWHLVPVVGTDRAQILTFLHDAKAPNSVDVTRLTSLKSVRQLRLSTPSAFRPYIPHTLHWGIASCIGRKRGKKGRMHCMS
jgi:hypothetical protein